MKRSLLVAFSVIALCGILLPTTLVNAFYGEGYETSNYLAIYDCTVDGAWTTDNEWFDAMTPPNLPADFEWRQKWIMGDVVMQYFLIEFFTDNTDDAGDYFQICFDILADGGSAPKADDIKVEWVGHSELTLYQGDGSGWVEYTDYAWETDVYVVDSLTTSILNGETHWVIEVFINRGKAEFDTSGAGYVPGIRVAVYDEGTETLAAWPPTSADVPDDWGQENGVYGEIPEENIPESLTFVTAALLSSVAVVVSCYLLRRRPKTEKN
jgi:hypothetical protein